MANAISWRLFHKSCLLGPSFYISDYPNPFLTTVKIQNLQEIHKLTLRRIKMKGHQDTFHSLFNMVAFNTINFIPIWHQVNEFSIFKSNKGEENFKKAGFTKTLELLVIRNDTFHQQHLRSCKANNIGESKSAMEH